MNQHYHHRHHHHHMMLPLQALTTTCPNPLTFLPHHMQSLCITRNQSHTMLSRLYHPTTAIHHQFHRPIMVIPRPITVMLHPSRLLTIHLVSPLRIMQGHITLRALYQAMLHQHHRQYPGLCIAMHPITRLQDMRGQSLHQPFHQS